MEPRAAPLPAKKLRSPTNPGDKTLPNGQRTPSRPRQLAWERQVSDWFVDRPAARMRNHDI